MSNSIEKQIRTAFAAGDLEQAAVLGIEAYGPEILGYLIATLRSEDEGGEVFAQASENLWQSLDRFAWRCSFRTWFFRLARNAASRFRATPARRAGRAIPLSRVTEVAERVRSRTQPWLRTELKDGLRRIREGLSEPDQTLLILRVDRGLSWREIAHVLADPDEEVERVSARLRKRFQALKAELRERAVAEGLLGEDGR